MEIVSLFLFFGVIYGYFYLKKKVKTPTTPKLYDNLLAICGRKTKNGHNKKTIAYLILENTNPVDKNKDMLCVIK